jgi:hypothetical protein
MPRHPTEDTQMAYDGKRRGAATARSRLNKSEVSGNGMA